ncbi:MAG TPA: COX15/CtaA family protein [Candidatus Binataceae bacterium]|nr:COX15/CtaA family protein [Candidatus Binataceae bacterium]
MIDDSFPPVTAASNRSRGLHRWALLAAIMTFILIFVGGLVTTTGSGLSVPDWPLAFGKLVPPHWVGGIRFEYSHRVAAGTVTILTFSLAVWAWMAEARRWVRNLALAACGLVIAQALLGAMNVLFRLPLPVTVAHAAIAPAFFCLMVGLAMFTNPSWDAMLPARTADRARPTLRTLTVLTVAAVYLQIIIGALMRNMGAGLAIPDFPLNYGHLVPPGWSAPIAVNFAHRCGALVVTILVVWTVARIARRHRDEPRLMRPAIGLLTLLAIQITLGALTIWTRRAMLPTTAHVAVGAGVLATAFFLSIRVARLTRVADAAQAPAAQPDYARDRTVAGRGVAS